MNGQVSTVHPLLRKLLRGDIVCPIELGKAGLLEAFKDIVMRQNELFKAEEHDLRMVWRKGLAEGKIVVWTTK